ncbi:hotdog fold thioesterase [Staphylococcus durrellii]|uniref:hotdog fold thioesterase n=1 Tax=Staphylococcus durrellii TaxID=2781773 RepID=UPI0018A06655|nr:PaaI family thioesterase [Staphylococcus durrellii]MBF7017541.1 PaaI family thioesterase [Staphylococcus durrellii]
MSTMLDALEMKIEKQEHGLMVVSMPVTDKVKQPFGYLHGGASLALGETACSMGAAYIIDTDRYTPLGLEMNANHIGSTVKGMIYATATIIHEGKTTQVWNIEIKDDTDRLICIMRGTMAIKERKR